MLSDDFRGYKSQLICLNLLNISDSAMIRNQTEYDIFGIRGVTLLFEHSPSRSSEIEHFEILSRPRENQLARHFFVKFNLLFLMLGLFYSYTEEYKHNNCFLKTNKPLQYVQNKTS